MKQQINKEKTPVMYRKESLSSIRYGNNIYDQNYHVDFPLHWHEMYELLLIKNGSLKISLFNKIYNVSGPALFFIPPEEEHSVKLGSLRCEYSMFQFDAKFFINSTKASNIYLEPLSDYQNNKIYINHPCIKNEDVISSAYDLDNACMYYSKNPLIANGFLLVLLGNILDSKILKFESFQKNSNQFDKIIEYIEKNFTENISSKSVSEKFGYNESYFCKRFKEIFGITFSNYINRLRLEHSCKLLTSTNQSISLIATSCGFSDINYFSFTFKKFFGVSPSGFRKNSS